MSLCGFGRGFQQDLVSLTSVPVWGRVGLGASVLEQFWLAVPCSVLFLEVPGRCLNNRSGLGFPSVFVCLAFGDPVGCLPIVFL